MGKQDFTDLLHVSKTGPDLSCFFSLIVSSEFSLKASEQQIPEFLNLPPLATLLGGLQPLIVVVYLHCLPFFVFSLKKALNPLRTEGA